MIYIALLEYHVTESDCRLDPEKYMYEYMYETYNLQTGSICVKCMENLEDAEDYLIDFLENEPAGWDLGEIDDEAEIEILLYCSESKEFKKINKKSQLRRTWE